MHRAAGMGPLFSLLCDMGCGFLHLCHEDQDFPTLVLGHGLPHSDFLVLFYSSSSSIIFIHRGIKEIAFEQQNKHTQNAYANEVGRVKICI